MSGFLNMRASTREVLGGLGADGHLHQGNVEF
jgi:hypothetical protein